MPLAPTVSGTVEGDVVILRPVGDFDMDCVDMLRSSFLDAVGTTHSQVVVDLSGTTFVDSITLGVMLGFSRHVHARDGWVRLAGVRPNIRNVLRMTGLDQVFESFSDVPAAIAGVRQDSETTSA